MLAKNISRYNILCTLDYCLSWPCSLFGATHTSLHSLLCTSHSAVPVLCFPINFILCLLVLVLCLPCHWNWPCFRLQWPAVTSPSHACDLSAPLGLTAAHSHLPTPFFLLRPGGDAPWAQPESSHTPSFRLSTCSLPDRLAAAYCAQISLPEPQLQSLTRPWTDRPSLAAAAQSCATSRSCRSCPVTRSGAALFQAQVNGVLIPADGRNCEVVHFMWFWCRTKQTWVEPCDRITYETLLLITMKSQKESPTLQPQLASVVWGWIVWHSRECPESAEDF